MDAPIGTITFSATELHCLCALAGGSPPLGLPTGGTDENGAILAAHLRLGRRGYLVRRPDDRAIPAPALAAPLAALACPALVVLASLAPASGHASRLRFYLDGAVTVELAATTDGRYDMTVIPSPETMAARLGAWWGLVMTVPDTAALISTELLTTVMRLREPQAIVALLSAAGVEGAMARSLAATMAAPAWRGALQVIAPAEAAWLQNGLTVLGGAGGAWALRGVSTGSVEIRPARVATLADDIATAVLGAERCRTVG